MDDHSAAHEAQLPQEAGAGLVISAVTPAPLQRGVGLLFVLLIGAFFLWSGLFGGDEGRRPVLLLPAAIAFWFSWRLGRATALGLELTEDELRDTDGRVLVRVAQILAVDRGTFAFKPSGGFVLKLADAPGTAWQPGLWWRFGKRLGVGGVTARVQARHMADAIAVLLVDRDEAARGQGGAG